MIVISIKKGKPQTPAGAKLFADFNRSKGTNYPYDPEYMLASWKRRKEYFAKKAQNQSTSSNKASSSRHRRRIEDTDDEGEDEPITVPSSSVTQPSTASRKPSSTSTALVTTTTTRSTTTTSKPGATKPSMYSHISIIDTWSEDDENNEDNENDNDIQEINMDSVIGDQPIDEYTSSSLCVPVEMNGKAVCHALVDQGCNKMIMRQSAMKKYHIDEIVTIYTANNYVVVTASGKKVPILYKFMTRLTINNQPYNDQAIVYVINDKPESDINCDIVLGRQVMATSKYRLIDTYTARLLSSDLDKLERDRNYIQCLVAKCVKKENKYIIVPTSIQPVSSIQLSSLLYDYSDDNDEDSDNSVLEINANEKQNRRPLLRGDAVRQQ